LSRAGQSHDVGSMAVTADSFPPLATFFVIRGRNQAKRRKPHAQIAEQSLRGPRQETGTCCTTSASSEEATTNKTKHKAYNWTGTSLRLRLRDWALEVGPLLVPRVHREPTKTVLASAKPIWCPGEVD
jgi:hypothetical protein